MRDVKEENTRVLVLSSFLCAKDEFDQQERGEFPCDRRISAVVVLGVPGRAVHGGVELRHGIRLVLLGRTDRDVHERPSEARLQKSEQSNSGLSNSGFECIVESKACRVCLDGNVERERVEHYMFDSRTPRSSLPTPVLPLWCPYRQPGGVQPTWK